MVLIAVMNSWWSQMLLFLFGKKRNPIKDSEWVVVVGWSFRVFSREWDVTSSIICQCGLCFVWMVFRPTLVQFFDDYSRRVLGDVLGDSLFLRKKAEKYHTVVIRNSFITSATTTVRRKASTIIHRLRILLPHSPRMAEALITWFGNYGILRLPYHTHMS